MLNLLSNNNLIENNLFSYGLIIGSVSILSFSLYYYFYSNSSSDSVNATSSNENLDQISNTVGKQYVNTASQTDDTMLYDYLNERLMANMDPSITSQATHYSPTDFIREYNENPHFTNYIDNIVSWSNNVSESTGTRQVFRNGMFPTTNSEHQFANLSYSIKDLRSYAEGGKSNLDWIRDHFSDCSLTQQRLLSKLHDLVNTKVSYTVDQVNNIYTNYCVMLTDSNVEHIADMIVRSANTFS